MSQELSIFPDECLMNASALKVKNEYFSGPFNRRNYPGHYLFQPCTWLWSKTKRLHRYVRGTCTVCSVYFQMYLSSDSDLTKWKEKIGDGKTCWPETECIINVAHGRVLGILAFALNASWHPTRSSPSLWDLLILPSGSIAQMLMQGRANVCDVGPALYQHLWRA